jgi:hypothetical protein
LRLYLHRAKRISGDIGRLQSGAKDAARPFEAVSVLKGNAMHGVARNFFLLAILYAVGGMALGLHMSITHDHSQMPVHAHAMAAGWLMSAVFSFFYHLVPTAARGILPTIQFWLTGISGIGLVVGLFFLLGGNADVEPVVAVASLGFYAGTLLFTVIAVKALFSANRLAVSRNGTDPDSLSRNAAAR